jgi:ribose/xylose/arabinose/galactoside ABC-type transport system permease subunit
LVLAWWVPNFRTPSGLAALLDAAVLTGLVAIGVGLTMIAGEMDLSVGSMAAIAGVLAIQFISAGVPLLPALLAVVLTAAIVGAIQGLLIHLLNINSLIFTIGTLIGFRGLALMLAHESTQTLPIDKLSIADSVSGHFGVLSPLSVTLVLAFLAVGFFASRTVWGREIYAIGGGRTEARSAGVSLRRPLVIAFSCSAGMAALGGALLSIRSGGATPLGYNSVLLDAVAACLIGGIALRGGRGGLAGIFVGLLTLRVVVSGVASLGAPFWAQTLASGLLLILVITGESISRTIMRRRHWHRTATAQG